MAVRGGTYASTPCNERKGYSTDDYGTSRVVVSVSPTRLRERGLVVVIALLVTTSVLGAAFGPAAVSGASQKADVVFVFDKTGSMDTQAAALKDEVEDVASELDSSGVDARYALVTYEGADNTEVRQQLTSDTQALKDELDFSTEGATENASHGIHFSLDNLEFRDDARKIFVVITDEDDDGSADSRTRALERLDAEGACLVAVSPEPLFDSVGDELKTMAEQVECGQWTDIESESFTTVVTNLVDIIEDVTGGSTDDTVVGAKFEVVDASVNETTVYVGEPVRVTVTVENVGGSVGTYDAMLSTITEVHFSDDVELSGGESHTFTTTVTFGDIGAHDLQLNHRTFTTVDVERPPPDLLDPADVDLVETHLTRSTVVAGGSYDVVTVVENTGGEPGRAKLAFSGTASNATNGTSNGTTTVNRTVVLAPGETAAVHHTETTTSNLSGTTTHAWNVSVGANATRAGDVTVLPTEDAESGVVDAFARPSTVGPGAAYEVTAVLHNAADEEQLFTLHFAAQDGSSETKLVWVDAGQTVEFSETYTAPDEAGTVDWTVNGEPAVVTVSENETAGAT